MGVYNPRAPHILGEEWAPIRDEEVSFSPAVNAVELGHGLTLTATRLIQDIRFYVNTFPTTNSSEQQIFQAAVYPAGLEAATGPVRRVVIPANSVAVTGASATTANLLNPADASSASLFAASNTQMLRIGFATNGPAGLLSKRILAVNLLYTAYTFGASFDAMNTNLSIVNAASQAISFGEIQGNSADYSSEVRTFKLGEANYFWQTAPAPGGGEVLPWRYSELQRFESTNGNPITVQIKLSTNSDPAVGAYTLFIGYAALEIYYCDEQRILVGGRLFDSTNNYTLGMNAITMRSLSAFGTNFPLVAGAYTQVLSSADPNSLQLSLSGGYPLLNGARQLYSIPPHPGIQVNETRIVGDAFTKESTNILPQLTMHTSGGPVLEGHVYGKHVKAPVYGAVTATQEIDDALAGGVKSWPWVRFYARRFGNTSVPLTFDSPTITGAGLSVSITPASFDLLDEIIDGWKEVTLRFVTAPTMGAGTNPQWRWSAVGENVGNRWEVLGAIAPALSGIPSNLNNQVPAPHQLSTATYGAQDNVGAIDALGWLPITAIFVADDPTADAVVFFAQDMPTVTGFSVIGTSQAVTGIGLDCGGVPCCVPSAILYNRITWSAVSSGMAASGFGYYELQRMDTLGDWQTIMKNTAPAATGFSDFESRVGILTSYRIRSVDNYGFYGAWSNTLSITMARPGLTAGCVTGGHVLIFTTNEIQSGRSNLGYSSAWENGQVTEDFTFPEAGFNQLQTMYQKDFYTAFRPTERGGVQFTRTVLVQAAAISPETLADFTDLRSMAWNQVPYICVRDEDGNRWFANVTVPSGRVIANRSIYLAPVNITKVTDTPSPTNPGF